MTASTGSSDPGTAEPALHDDLLEPEALGERRQPAGDVVELVEGDVDRRPDVEHHPVPLELASLRRARRSAWRMRVEAGDQHVLDLGQGDDAAGARRGSA